MQIAAKPWRKPIRDEMNEGNQGGKRTVNETFPKFAGAIYDKRMGCWLQ